MRSSLKRGAVVTAGFALAAGGFAAVPAHAATVVPVRPADLVAPQGTIGGATMQFLAEGVHLKVPNAATDLVRARFKAKVPLAQVHTVEYEWFGTANPPAQTGAPGIFYGIDIDGDGKPDGELVGELFYGGKDVWLNRDAEDFGVTPTVPAGTFTNLSPCGGIFGQTPQNGNQDGCMPGNGAGSAVHGTLDDWNRSLSAGGRTPTIVQGGFVGGLVMDGVLRSATYGPTQYLFTNAPKVAVTVKARAAKQSVKTGSKIKVSGTAKPVGPGATASLQKKTNGKWKTLSEKALADDGAFKFTTKAPGKPGKVKLRVQVSETSSTATAKSKKMKIVVK